MLRNEFLLIFSRGGGYTLGLVRQNTVELLYVYVEAVIIGTKCRKF